MSYRITNNEIVHDDPRHPWWSAVSYKLEQPSFPNGRIVLRAFTSGGWWKTDGAFDSWREARASLSDLCARLNA